MLQKMYRENALSHRKSPKIFAPEQGYNSLHSHCKTAIHFLFVNLSPMQNQSNSDYQQYSYIYIKWPFDIALKKRTSDPLKLMFSVSVHLWPHPTNSNGLRCYLSLVTSIASWKSLCIKSRTLTVSSQGYRWSKKPVIGLDKTIVNNLKV